MGIEESESIWSSATGGIASWEVMNFDLKLIQKWRSSTDKK